MSKGKRSRRRLALLTAMAFGVMAAASGASAQDRSDQSILARDLRSSDVGEVFAALTAATARQRATDVLAGKLVLWPRGPQ